MIVCHCRGLTDRDLRAAADAGDGRRQEILARGEGGSCCGSCSQLVQDVLSRNPDPPTRPE